VLRRLSIALVIWLLIGLTATVSIAWTLAFLPLNPASRESYTANKGSTIVVCFRGTGWVRKGWNGPPRASIAPKLDSIDGAPSQQMLFLTCVESPHQTPVTRNNGRTPMWPPWGRLDIGSFGVDGPGHWGGCEHATGWPFLAFWYEMNVISQTKSTYAVSISGGLPFQSDIRLPADVTQARAFPIRPIWRGLAANTLLFALPGFAATLIIRLPSLRSRARLRRNHCPKCNYDLRATPNSCPECNWIRDPSISPVPPTQQVPPA
jgi:hypothetical protein